MDAIAAEIRSPAGQDAPATTREVALDRIRALLAAQEGQTTAEYSLVLLVAGLVVGVFAAFVKGGALAEMFKHIVSGLVARAGG
jgi:hypothetical protein